MDDKGNEFLQSYEKIIIQKTKGGIIYFDSHFWNFSKTTSRNRQLFLQETTKQTQMKIQRGIYKFKDLN